MYRCEDTSNCGAFTFDPTSSTCELGEGLDLPADEVASGGKEVIACKEQELFLTQLCYSLAFPLLGDIIES